MCTETIFSFDITQVVFNLLSILSFCMSGILFLIRLRSRRVNLDVIVNDYSQELSRKHIHIFMTIQNNSTLPICIQSISLVKEQAIYPCELIEKKIKPYAKGILYSSRLPVNLLPHEGRLSLFEFLDCLNIEAVPGTHLAFQIQTNRGEIKQSLTLGNISHYLNNGEGKRHILL